MVRYLLLLKYLKTLSFIPLFRFKSLILFYFQLEIKYKYNVYIFISIIRILIICNIHNNIFYDI